MEYWKKLEIKVGADESMYANYTTETRSHNVTDFSQQMPGNLSKLATEKAQIIQAKFQRQEKK